MCRFEPLQDNNFVRTLYKFLSVLNKDLIIDKCYCHHVTKDWVVLVCIHLHYRSIWIYWFCSWNKCLKLIIKEISWRFDAVTIGRASLMNLLGLALAKGWIWLVILVACFICCRITWGTPCTSCGCLVHSTIQGPSLHSAVAWRSFHLTQRYPRSWLSRLRWVAVLRSWYDSDIFSRHLILWLLLIQFLVLCKTV